MVETESTMPEDWKEIYRGRRFGILLAILLLLLAGPPLLFGFGMPARWFDGLISSLLLAAILPLCFDRRQRFLALALGIPTVLFSLSGLAFSGTVGEHMLLIAHLLEATFLFSAAVLIIKSLFDSRSLTFDSILGTACGYLFLGAGWAVLYSMLENLRPGSFAVSQSLLSPGVPSHPLPHALTYYSFVTLTTVGYGDITPNTPTACTLAWIESMTGQFYIAVFVAGLVSLLLSTRLNCSEENLP